MRPSELLTTVYRGDRACKGISVDTWKDTVRIQADCISRTAGQPGQWRLESDRDIEDGWLVFEGVTELQVDNEGKLPNDLINAVRVLQETEQETEVEISIDSIDSRARHSEVFIRLRCRSVHLEDPRRPGVAIT